MRLPLLLPGLCAALAAVLEPVAARGAAADGRLEELLRRYPAADTNGDGVLTIEEAQAYAKGQRKSGRKEPDGKAVPKPAPTHAEVSYGPHPQQKLDLWLAPSSGPTPLLVYIHGGGFVSGSKSGVGGDMIKPALEAGVSLMSIDYRFRPGAPIQDILRDCARAIQFVRSRAKDYRLDPRRIAAYGGSAGAGASLWLAFHPDLADPENADPVLRESSRIVAAGALNTQATYNTTRWREFLGVTADRWTQPGEEAAFYGAKSEDELRTPRFRAILDDVDMLRQVTADDPPIFLYSAQPDGEPGNRSHVLHHPNHAREVAKACAAAGVPCTLALGMAEPRYEGNPQAALRQFLFERLQRP